jgi:hypothetical protein
MAVATFIVVEAHDDTCRGLLGAGDCGDHRPPAMPEMATEPPHRSR